MVMNGQTRGGFCSDGRWYFSLPCTCAGDARVLLALKK